MAASRIARLTLFSGPQCSLCEIAKAELAKVKKQRDFNLEVINIQDKGQERWKKKYVYWIPALHLDGMEIAKVGSSSDSFVIDTTSSIHPSALSLYLYDRISDIALGEEEDELLPSAAQHLRLCFNCGSPDHAVASCPEPINRQLVSLSRQLFNFLHPEFNGQEFSRLYIAEGWKRQRLEWLNLYEPGVIRGPLLRDALALEEGDSGNAVEWLRNMAYWGYPPGWIGRQDPTELVCRRILEDEEGQVSITESDPFMVFDGVDDEEIDLRLLGPQASPTTSRHVREERTRWANYPDTYFSSRALSVYNGAPLGRLDPSPSRVSVTFTAERKALWDRILSSDLHTSGTLPVPPWRVPGAFYLSENRPTLLGFTEDLAPPPSTTPPPLPVTPSSFRASTLQKCLVTDRELTRSPTRGAIDVADDGSIADMDLSDNSE